MCVTYTGNLLFHIACEIYNKRRGHLNAGFKNFLRRYKEAYEFMGLKYFILDNFKPSIYKQAIKILFERVD